MASERRSKVGALPSSDRRLALPLYTAAEAARVLGVPPATFSTWVRGYVRRPPGRKEWSGAPIVTSLPTQHRRQPTIPFMGLAEGMVLAAIRRAGVPLQRVRPALDVLDRQMGIEHALASERLFTDGAEVLFDFANALDGDEDAVRSIKRLVVIRNGQQVFTEVVEKYLKKIHYDVTGFADKLSLPQYENASIVVDPSRSFGQPIFAEGGARVADVLDRFWAGEDLAEVAHDYGVPISSVEDVIRVASRQAA